MSTPQRLQRRRTKGWRTPLDANGQAARYVGRGSRFGNPWVVIQTPNGWAAKWVTGPGGTLPGPERRWIPTDTEIEARNAAVEQYAWWITTLTPELADTARELLAGRDLLCWCPLPEPGQPDYCHARFLLDIANPTTGGPR